MLVVVQGGLIAAIIMASLSRLGGNAHVAKRILKLLSTHLPGRVVLRLGAAKWQAQATGGEFASATGSKASLQWAASRLWAAGDMLHFSFQIFCIICCAVCCSAGSTCSQELHAVHTLSTVQERQAL